MISPPRALATVLVCEDDRPTLDLLCSQLDADRFNALPAHDAETALRLARSHRPDVLLLDLALPDMSGLDLLRLVREAEDSDERLDASLPIIFLSGSGSGADRLRCLESGADDFLRKPVPYRELLARIKNLLRRARRRPEEKMCFDELVIDTGSREVTVAGRTVDLSRKEYLLLCVLAEDPYRIFTKAELLLRVWGHSSTDHSRTLESHISRLRRKLDPEHGRYVYNAWGVGYRLLE